MNRDQKSSLLTSLKEQFSHSNGSLVVSYRGLTVLQLQKLRRGLRANGGSLKVTKARLMKIAAQDIPAAAPLIPYFKDQIGLVFTENQAPVIIKFLYGFAKENEALKILAGSLDSQLVDQLTLARLALLPSREVLLAQLCGLLNAPVTKLAYVLQQIEKQKSGN